MDLKSSIQAWGAILNGNKMIVVTTRNFLPEIGGMQILMSDLAKHLSKFYKVKVYAEVCKDSDKFDVVQNYEIIRIKGFKFIRKFRKILFYKYLLRNFIHNFLWVFIFFFSNFKYRYYRANNTYNPQKRLVFCYKNI